MSNQSFEHIGLTNHQLAIWLESRIHPGTAIHNIGTFVELNGVPNSDVLTQAIENVIEENDAMRLRISSGSGQGIQYFPKERSFSLLVKDFSKSENPTEDGEQWMHSEFIKPIQIDDSELYQIALVICGNQRSFIYFKFHHICTDGLSFALMVSNVSNHYNALLEGTKFSIKSSYADFAKTSLQRISPEEQMASKHYWKNKFKDFERVNLFRKKKTSFDENSRVSERIELPINKDTINAIALPDTAFEKGLFYYLLAAFYITISRSKGTNEIVIGLPLLGRKGEEELNTLGYFVSVIPLRLSFSKQLTFEELVLGIKAEMRENYLYRNISIHEINKELEVNISNSTLLYDVVFSFETFKRDVDFGSLKVLTSGTFPSGYEQLPLVLHVQDFNKDDDINFEFDFNLNYLNRPEANALALRYQRVLKHYIDNTHALIESAPILTEEEFTHLENLGEGPTNDLTFDNCIDPILKRAKELPEKVILSDASGSLTYSELMQHSQGIAAQLISRRTKPSETIAVMVPRSKESIVHILAVLLSGACYVPIDPYLPIPRIKRMLLEADVRKVLVPQGFNSSDDFSEFELIEPSLINPPLEYHQPVVSKSSPAYILFTSGTTGMPKGVQIHHGAILNLMDGLNQEVYHQYSSDGKLALMSAFHFDASVQQIYASLLFGRELVIVPADVRKDGALIAQFLDDNEIEITDGIPTHILSMISRTSGLSKASKLKHLIIGGEVFNLELARKFYAWCGDQNPKISNVYGPTECTVDATIFTFDKDTLNNLDTIPIGRPIQNNNIWVLDENQKPLPIGEVGEICIGGKGMSRGYVNQLDLTAKKFVSNADLQETFYHSGDLGHWDENGMLHFDGRMDDQVKLKGYRIELKEIEFWLNKIHSVDKSVVLLKDQGSQKVIVAFIQSTEKLNISDIKKELLKSLPEYMLPHFYEVLEHLPLNETGKIDRSLLRTAPISKKETENFAETELERKLASIFSQVLDIDSIDVETSFFSLGGDSLGLVFLLVEIEEQLDVSFSMRDFGTMNTVRSIADYLEAKNTIEISPISWREELPNLQVLNVNGSTPKGNIRNEKAFITGGTGFIGAFLIQEACASFQEVYCLVRANSALEGENRLRRTLEDFEINAIDWTKIKVVPGDLSKEHLGLSAEMWHEVSYVDQIYHCGAQVNFMKDFESMKQTNVGSTHELLQLCQMNHVKRFNFISTKGVFSDHSNSHHENDSLEEQVHFRSRGYESTKWLSDLLAQKSRSFGIECNIFRLGRITGHSQTGMARYDDFFHRFIDGCIAMGSFPQELLTLSTDLTPVDVTAKAILQLSQKNSNSNFHVSNNNATFYSEIVKGCTKKQLNLNIEPYSTWLEKVDNWNKLDQNNPLFLITPILKQKTWFDDRHILESKMTTKMMKEINITWPLAHNLWDIYIENCITRMIKKTNA